MNHDDLEDTARIDRRHAVIAQIEAALLSGRLDVFDAPHRATGTNPYDSNPERPQARGNDGWGNKRR
ncbi:MAG: hypothetical protein RL030_1015 [Pseudomonadota bacterium]